MRQLFYLMQKEFRQIFREKANLFILFVMPFIQLVIIGSAITTDVRNISIIMMDYDHSPASRAIKETFSLEPVFTLKRQTHSEAEAFHMLDAGHANLAIVVPPGFEKHLKQGRVPALQIMVDGVNGNTAGVILSYVAEAAGTLQRRWLSDLSLPAAPLKPVRLVTLEPKMLYNPALESHNFFVPGIVAILLTMITLFLTTINIVKEKEIGTLEQLLVTPIKPWQLILGKILPFGILGFVLLNVGVLASGFVFGVWLRGNIFTLWLSGIIYMVTTLGLGIFFSTIAHTQQQAMFFAWFFAIFSIILSGFFIPVENMPVWVQWLTYINPTRYFIFVVRSIYLKGAGLSVLWRDLCIMAAFGGTIIAVSAFRFRKRLL